MDNIILDQIPFIVDELALMDVLRIRPGSSNAAKFTALYKEAHEMAAPKAVYTIAETRMLEGDVIEISGLQFQSSLLCVNLEKAGTVFPFAATCGVELEEWSEKIKSALNSFWAGCIALMALGCAVNHLEACLKEKTGRESLSSMNPGSLPEWPLREQANIFALLGESAKAVGIRLTNNMSIRPQQSISGIYFVSEKGFCNCLLCPRKRCFTRRAPYNEGLQKTTQ